MNKLYFTFSIFLSLFAVNTVQAQGDQRFDDKQLPTADLHVEHTAFRNESMANLNYKDVVINEFMASNDSLSGLKDAAGDYDDWIELYNTTNEVIDLSNAYLSDDPDKPQKWAFPSDATIAPNGYLIIWADNDTDQEGMHANFKLKKAGDHIRLMDASGILDSLTFGEQRKNIAAARIPNGTGDFVFHSATFNRNNEEATPTNELSKATQTINIYPNPANDYITIKLEEMPEDGMLIQFYNSIGQAIFQQSTRTLSTLLSIQNLSPGIYFVRIEDTSNRLFSNQKIMIH